MTIPALADLHGALRAGTEDPVQLLEACQAKNSHGAYVTRLDTAARAQAEAASAAFRGSVDLGPLQGMPFAAKDLFGTGAGHPIAAGNPQPLPAIWDRAGPVMQDLTDQLSVCVGKSHTVCFAFGGVGANTHIPVPRNPFSKDVHRAPGGSSSGSGVSVAEGSSLFALGSDTAGSVRIPASVNGIAGYKSTKEFLSTDGVVPLSTTLDSTGILARSVEDVAFVMEGLVPANFRLPLPTQDLCLHVVTGSYATETDDDIAAAFGKAVEALAKVVDRVKTGPLDPAEEGLELFRTGPIAGVELAARLDNDLPEFWEGLDPLVRRRIEQTRSMTASDYLNRRYQVLDLEQRMNEVMMTSGIDLLILPTVPISPPEIPPLLDPANADTYNRVNGLMLRNTCFANISGMCGLSIPIGLDGHGMPIGLQVLAMGGMDQELIGIGISLERALWDAGLAVDTPV
ncbi:MAG: amidase [Alphaproteobacteria bacterium]|nr:amidase [Alphaproteobacteria bacterium SS10]